jgi:hypothetical protein
MSAMGFRWIFDIKNFWMTFRLKVVFGPSWSQSQISIAYHSIVNKNEIRGQFIFWVFIAIFEK